MAVRFLIENKELGEIPLNVPYEVENRRVPAGMAGWSFVSILKGAVLSVETREDGKYVSVWAPDGEPKMLRFAEGEFDRTPTANVGVDATPEVRAAYAEYLLRGIA
jgi:hypothetical protein